MSVVDYARAIYAPWARRHGNNPEEGNNKYGKDNNFAEKHRNAADTADVETIRVGRRNFVQLAGTGKQPSYAVKTFNLEPNASLVDQVFFIADRDYEVKAIYEIHKTLCSVALTTATIRRCRAAGVAAAAGDALCSPLDMTSPNSTVVEATLSTTAANLKLEENDRLSIDFSGTTTALAGVTIVVVLAPGHTTETAVFNVAANGDLADRAFFLAPMPMKIASIKYCHATAGTDASAVTAMVKKQDGTETVAQGDSLLTAGFDCKGAIDTVQEGALTATVAYLRLAPGDRLSVDFTGTLTALAGVCIVVEFEPLEDRKLVTFFMPQDGAAILDQTFFIADRDYEIVAASAVWQVASSGATNFQLTVDKAAEAPGAGVDLLSLDTAAGFQTDGTAYTPEVATFVSTQNNFLKKGDRLSVDLSGTLTALVGPVANVVLKPC